jgi:peptidoglycan/LPS O-acetylase OafA/YrhL
MAVAGWLSPHGWLAHIGTMKAETIFLGGAAALVAHHLGGFRALGAAVGHRWSSAALAAALVAGAMLGWHDAWLQLTGVALVVACAVRPEHLLRRLLESAPLRYLGTLSYALYLLHPMAIHGVRRLLPESTPQPLLLAVVLACSIAAAAIAHRVVEAPFLRIKEAISRRQKERTPLPVSIGAARSPSTS